MTCTLIELQRAIHFIVVPMIPVLVTLVTDLSTGDDPIDDIIVTRTGEEQL